MSSSSLTILVLAKAPAAGRSKTRLAPRYGMDGAARLAAAALADSLDAARRVPAARHVLVLDGSLDPGSAEIARLAGGFEVIPQVKGGHAERIIAAFESASGSAVLIGMDTPQIRPSDLWLELSEPIDAWLGPASDGGWWALGLRHAARDARRVIEGVPMSTPFTGARQRARLLAAGLTVRELARLRDVDEPADADAVAASAPRTRFARQVAELAAGGAPR